MRTIWITGAQGFIGRHLARYISDESTQVVGLGHGLWHSSDANKWGVTAWLNGHVSASNLTHLLGAYGTPSAIYHLAGGSSVGAAVANPHEDFQRTVTTSAELLDWLRLHAPDIPLVAVSSAAVYGAGHDGAIAEDAVASPSSPYGTHKLLMEELCRSYTKTYGMSIILPRLFSVYGSDLRKQLLWDICCKLAYEKALELGGSGSELRDWTNVNDIAHVLSQLPGRCSHMGGVINIAAGEGVRVIDIATVAISAWVNAGRKPPESLHFNGKNRIGDPDSLVADVTRLTNLGMRCTTPWRRGIEEYVRWYISAGNLL